MAVYIVKAKREAERGAFDIGRALTRLPDSRTAIVEADSDGEAFTRARIAFPARQGWDITIHKREPKE